MEFMELENMYMGVSESFCFFKQFVSCIMHVWEIK